MYGLILAEHHALQVVLKIAQKLGIGLRHRFGRYARHGRDGCFHLLDADGPLALRRRQQHLRGARLVDHVDGLIGKLAVVDVFGRKLHGGFDGLVRVFDVVEVLEIGLEALHDLDRVLDRRLGDIDLLEPADERAVLFEVLAVFFVGCRADAAQHARLQRRLQEVRGVHRAARGRARADDRVDFVDEQDRARIGFDLLHDGLQPFLEIAAVARTGEQRAHVEREDRRVGEHLRAPRRARSCARDLRQSPFCRRQDRRHRADCSSTGGRAPGWCARSPCRGRSADRSARPSPSGSD